MSTQLQVQYIADSHINDTKKSLVSSFELALVEYLHGDNGGVLDSAEIIVNERR